MAFSKLIRTMKNGDGLIKILDQYYLKQDASEEDSDRKNVTNSPSSSLGCVRANYYQRSGEKKEVIEPRVRRIFDNGHAVHERIQNALLKEGTLLMDEVPLQNEEYEIQGHTDGFLKIGRDIKILEIKSINSMGFSKLREAREDHRAQAQVYIFSTEQHRLKLKELYPSQKDFNKSKLKRIKEYRELYQHLKDGSKYTREEKIWNKVKQHLTADNILYNSKYPVEKAIILYENKDTQEMKEYEVGIDGELMEEILYKFSLANKHWRDKEIPPKECSKKSDGRFCPYKDICFPL